MCRLMHLKANGPTSENFYAIARVNDARNWTGSGREHQSSYSLRNAGDQRRPSQDWGSPGRGCAGKPCKLGKPPKFQAILESRGTASHHPGAETGKIDRLRVTVGMERDDTLERQGLHDRQYA